MVVSVNDEFKWSAPVVPAPLFATDSVIKDVTIKKSFWCKNW